jgi:phosphatidylinositol glycan class O
MGSQEKSEGEGSVLPQQIDAYTDFLQTFAKLARSAWTEFDLRSMSMGLLLIILTVIIQSWTLVKLNTICQSSDQKSAGSSIILKLSFAFALVAIRAASFLSNSYICESDELVVLYALLFMYICFFLSYMYICFSYSLFLLHSGRR